MHKSEIKELLEMETKSIKEICEKLECTVKNEISTGIEHIDTKELGEVIDMIKDCYEAKEKLIKGCYYKKIMESMEKEEEEEEKDKEAWKKAAEIMQEKEEYEQKRMFYRGQPRSSSGRFISRGDGRRSNRGRRSYTEPLIYEYDPEFTAYLRGEPERMYYDDIIRSTGVSTATASGEPYVNPNEMNRYYSGSSGSSGGSSGMGGSSSSGRSGGASSGGGSSTSYYSSNNRNEGRSGRSRSYYMEAKSKNSGNAAHDNNMKMQGLEKYTQELATDIKEMIEGASEQEKRMLSDKLEMLAKNI